MELNYMDLGMKVLGILILAIVLLFVLTWSGMVSCGDVPYWCEVYESVLGSPRVLIVHGDAGLGDPDALSAILRSPTVGVSAVDIASLDMLSLGNLKRYKLVVVEKARKMNMEQLQMFMDYVQLNGGRLVWVGDAGTEKGANELNNLVDVNSLKKMLDNPWARAKEEETSYSILNFDEFLGLRYVGNYCSMRTCTNQVYAGTLKTELTGDHPLIYGIAPALELRVKNERDFSIVQQFANASNSNIVLSLDQGSVLNANGKTLPRHLPMIVTSGLGERIAYYSYPLEYMVQDNNYSRFVVQMYYGMLGK
ncbi:MAG: hypothetical protein HOE11_04260 [Candidatus Diapherotrites archaeon]|nr:hypothetical protein [Candidatus Diapherotrites archaeon]MBT4597293.1 hypothetical protein [Candidatus Diapherotrites archaeon]